MVNSGEDAAPDSIISASALAAAVIYIIWHISLEAVLGSVISVVIIKSGVQIDELIRRIFDKVFAEHHIALTGISVYAFNTSDPLTVKARKEIGEAVMNIEHIKQLHGFYMNHTDKSIRFDLVISLNAKDRTAFYKEALSTAQALYPDYTLEVVMDTNYAEA